MKAQGRQPSADDSDAEDVDRLRAIEYRLIGALLARAPDQPMLDRVARLGGGPGTLGGAHGELARAAAAADPASVRREFFQLFVGVGRGELLPYASYYLTGFLNERPLQAVRADLVALGVERAEGLHEPEDHIAILSDTMALVAEGRARAADAGRSFFGRHLAPWAGRFFADLAAAPSARFYRAVAGVGAAFVEVEARAFAIEDEPAHPA
jgi:TorA maturation chaperone TorD